MMKLVTCERRHAQGLLLVFAQVVHVEVAVRFEPVLVHLDLERPDQPQEARRIREDPDDVGPPLDLSFRRSKMLVDLRCL